MNQHCDSCGLIDDLYHYRELELCQVCYEMFKKQDDEILGRDEYDEQR